MRGRFRRHRIGAQEMNITAFMNLMVILVPFLLITAVFTRLSIIELNVPAGGAGGADTKQLHLEVIVRPDALEIGERSSGVLKRIENTANGYDYRSLSLALQGIKERFPDHTQITILSERNTSYDTLVQVMDTVRVMSSVQGGSVTRFELFPDISIGDAPARGNSAAGGSPTSGSVRVNRGSQR
jgi:biopolymer transport protein ExbD